MPGADCEALQVVTAVRIQYSIFAKIGVQTLQFQLRSHLFGACNFACGEVMVELVRILTQAHVLFGNRFAVAFKRPAATGEFHSIVANDMIRATDCYCGESLDFAERMILTTTQSPQVRT